MRQNTFAKRCTDAGALAFALALAAPALAYGSHGADGQMPPPAGADMPMPPQMQAPMPPQMPPMSGPGMHPGWQGGPPPMPQVDPRAREAWLGECRSRMSNRDHYEGHRADYDYCEAYFDDYYAHYAPGGYGYGAYGYGYGYAVPMMMVAVPHRQVRDQDCVEEVVSEEYVPVHRRVIHRAPRYVPDKRIRVAPDKRVPAS